MRDPAISVTVRTRSVCGWFAAGNDRKFVRSERLPPEKLVIASRV
jgi:hypothetical protein